MSRENGNVARRRPIRSARVRWEAAMVQIDGAHLADVRVDWHYIPGQEEAGATRVEAYAGGVKLKAAKRRELLRRLAAAGRTFESQLAATRAEEE